MKAVQLLVASPLLLLLGGCIDYLPVKLSLPAPSTTGEALRINERNVPAKRVQVAGYAVCINPNTGTRECALLWEYIASGAGGNAQIFDIGVQSAYRSRALGLNDPFPSQVVGWGAPATGDMREARRWEKNGNSVLPANGGTLAEARDVNNSGAVVGWVSDATGKRRATLWSPGPIDLGTLGGDESEAFAINESGSVVGASRDASGQWHAFIWGASRNDGVSTNPRMRDLHLAGFAQSHAYDVNDNDEVVGELEDGARHGFRWTTSTGGLPLPALGTWAVAYGINNAGIVVGASDGRAVRWESSGVVDINSRIRIGTGVVTACASINELGDLACTGRPDPSSPLSPYLLMHL